MSNTSKSFIIDEWIWHDLSGENGEEKRRESFKFLHLVFEKCDKIATIKNSKFEKKFFNFSERTDPFSHKIMKFYRNYIFYNSEKYIRLNDEECEQISEDIPSEINQDDHYLVRLYYNLHCPIITTDNPLLKVLENYQIQCEHRDNFLPHYIGEENQ